MSIDPKKFGLSASLVNAVNEALKGGQVKLDKNHNGKLDSDDFKKLRGEQSPADYDKNNFKHGMLGTDKKMKNEVADGNKANFKANMKEDETKPATKIVAKPQYDKTRPAFTEPKKKVNEAAEQVDEVSKRTIASYVDKAEKSSRDLEGKNDDKSWRKMHKRDDSVLMAKDKWAGKRKVAATEEVEQVDELSKDTLQKYIRKASTDAAMHAHTAGVGSRGRMNINSDKYHMKASSRLQGVSKAAQKLAKEEVEQVNETVKTTHENPLVTVHDKDGLHTHANLSTANKIFNTNVKHTDVHKGNVMVTSGHKDKNKLKFAISKHHATKVRKLTKEEVVDEAAVAGNNVVADMDARKTEVQRKIAQKQASFQQSKANKRISSPTMKEAKCTCGEGKGSKMTCEVCNSDKGLKGGKEPILINPPLKEGSNLMHQLRNQLASKTK